MLYKWNKSGMKMLIDSDYKTFNKQTNLITNGNVISNTQYSNYIRVDYIDYDLKYFNIDGFLSEFIRNLTSNFTLYEFFIRGKNRNKNIIGHLVEQDGKIIYNRVFTKTIRDFNNVKIYEKKESALNLCKAIIESKL